MPLQNIFAVGACDVGVYYGATNLWDGILAPGQSSPQFAGNAPLEVIQLVVNVDGTVELDWISGSGPSQGYTVFIQPFFSLATATQILVEQINNPHGVSGVANASANFSGIPRVLLSGSGSTWTPDPADITATLGATPGIYFYQGASF